MANGQYNYLDKPKVDVYSRLAAGVVQFDETGINDGPSYTTLAFQVTAIGARIEVRSALLSSADLDMRVLYMQAFASGSDSECLHAVFSL